LSCGWHCMRPGPHAGSSAQTAAPTVCHTQLGMVRRKAVGRRTVVIDHDGTSVWTADRCDRTGVCRFQRTQSKFDESGKGSAGGGMFVWPHGPHVDRDGNVGGRLTTPTAEELKMFLEKRQGRGGQVQSRGQGAPDARGSLAWLETARCLTDPTNAAPNGDIYRGSHTDNRDPNSSDGSRCSTGTEFIKSFGKGTGPGEFGRCTPRLGFPGPADRCRPP
jgi:hypothetical protein